MLIRELIRTFWW